MFFLHKLTFAAHSFRATTPAQVSLQSQHVKDLRACVGKLGKAIDTSFPPGFEPAQGPEWRRALDDALVFDAVAEHFFREGAPSLGEAFSNKGSGDRDASLRSTIDHATLQGILNAIEIKSLDELFGWIDLNRDAMTNASSEGLAISEFASRRSAVSQTQEQAFADIGSDLLWLTNMCKCIELLDQGDALGALGLIQKMEPFASKCEIGHTHCFSGDEVSLRNLLWTCVYATGPGAFQDSHTSLNEDWWWAGLSNKFIKSFWASKGLPKQSPLLTAVTAGCCAMPSLVKLANALRVTGAGLEDFCEKTVAGKKVNAKQLPAELALPEQYQFAPIFVCPVSRDACEPPKKPTAGDPVAQQCADARGDYPTMLPCGLILSANSIENMGKQRVESKRGMTMYV